MQVPPAATVVPLAQLPASTKSLPRTPPRVRLASVSGASPEFVNVTAWAALFWPTEVVPKLSVVTDTETAGCGVAVPVPFSATMAGLAVALCAIDSCALLAPATVGRNVTCRLQLAPPLRTVPVEHVDAAPIMYSAALAPEIPMAPRVSGCPPVLRTVTAWAIDVELIVCVKLKAVGVTLATAGASAPVPTSDTADVPPVALCVIVTVALRAPATVGVNVTCKVQLPPAATFVPDWHVPPRANSALAVPPSVSPVSDQHGGSGVADRHRLRRAGRTQRLRSEGERRCGQRYRRRSCACSGIGDVGRDVGGVGTLLT